MGIVIPQELIERLAAARRVAVLTGAGISAESGIPTFRDALTGLWANYDPQELATPEGFARNPKLVWDWYAERRARIEKEQRRFALKLRARAVKRNRQDAPIEPAELDALGLERIEGETIRQALGRFELRLAAHFGVQ